MPETTTARDADIRAIEALNEQDARAILANDVTTITSQWTEDFVMLTAGGPVVRGRAANADLAERGRQQLQAVEPVEYVADFEEIQICGDYAFEWGTFRSRTRLRASGDIVAHSGKLMRILQRQRDGSWKMHRTMLTVDASPR